MSPSGDATGPGKRPFYKYVSPDTALAILRTKTVRYSSPLLFNDPFDVQSGLHFDFDLKSLHRKVLDRLGELAAAPDAPSVDPEDVWGKVVLAARSYYPARGFPRERWSQMSAPLFEMLVGIIEDTQRRYRDHWREKLLPSSRIFCVTEERDNLLMWAHYAKEHTGAVLEFWSLPEEDNSLSVARPVMYASRPPPFFTEAEWLDDLMGIKKLDTSALYRRYAYVKSDHWSYEKEWRAWYPLATSPEMYDTVQLHPRELRAVYFGCRASSSFVQEAKTLVGNSFADVSCFSARKSEAAYELSYVEI
ncbi:DUF2971 domain-containing protein [Ramlibacter sp.]|uniref:DUF2971 domain-containing protein n=1 Tax=Ramlibacter sp. TaxID=1917967 RepID=UPI002FCB8567